MAGAPGLRQIGAIMFESAELRHEVGKAAYQREQASLRAALLNAQYDLKLDGRFPVLVLIAGVEGAGKGETVNLLNEWMDPRHIQTTAFGPPSDEEAERPAHWRFWRALPPKGQIGIFFGAWHTLPIVQRVMGDIGAGEFANATAEIQRLERMLSDEGVLLLKYWFHPVSYTHLDVYKRQTQVAAGHHRAREAVDHDQLPGHRVGDVDLVLGAVGHDGGPGCRRRHGRDGPGHAGEVGPGTRLALRGDQRALVVDDEKALPAAVEAVCAARVAGGPALGLSLIHI